GIPGAVHTAHLSPRAEDARTLLQHVEIKSVDATWREALRSSYLKALSYIEDQPQPFYSFSRAQRTDRIYPANPSALTLPKALRNVLAQRFTHVDLQSAQLVIAAALWECNEALERLMDE